MASMGVWLGKSSLYHEGPLGGSRVLVISKVTMENNLLIMLLRSTHEPSSNAPTRARLDQPVAEPYTLNPENWDLQLISTDVRERVAKTENGLKVQEAHPTSSLMPDAAFRDKSLPTARLSMLTVRRVFSKKEPTNLFSHYGLLPTFLSHSPAFSPNPSIPKPVKLQAL